MSRGQKPMGSTATKSGFFYEFDSSLPIAEIPPALPCPFCGTSDQISIRIERDSKTGNPSSHVECSYCGAESGFAGYDEDEKRSTVLDVVRESARLWNVRNGKEVQS